MNHVRIVAMFAHVLDDGGDELHVYLNAAGDVAERGGVMRADQRE
jgi:hypothetical protein